MTKKQSTRTPRQERSRETWDRIVEAGLAMFSEKGYYKTTSKDVARAAGVAIGSFYAYFPDKKELFKVILQYYQDKIKDSLTAIDINLYISTGDHRRFIRYIIDRLIESHEIYPDLHQEVEVMAHSDAEIRDILKKSKSESIDITRNILAQWKEKTAITDINAAAVVIEKSIEGVVHCIMFSDIDVDRERVIDELTEMIQGYIFKTKS